MNRVIKFKAKDCKGNWQIGNYYFGLKYPNSFEGHYVNDVLIDEKTLCQFIGIIDPNGKEIYEGDIYKRIGDKENRFRKDYEWADYWLVSWMNNECCFTTTRIAVNEFGKFLNVIDKESSYSKRFDELDEYIGNRYDNPELLGRVI